MDEIIFFGESSNEQDEDLPWFKDWINQTKDNTRPLEVITIFSGNKGLLLVTGEFKTFLFNKQSVTKQLIEALEVWSSGNEKVLPLVVCCINRKPQFGINKNGKKVIWHKDDSKYYSVRIDVPLTSEDFRGLKNPFLTQTIPPDSVGKEDKTPKGKQQPKTANSEG